MTVDFLTVSDLVLRTDAAPFSAALPEGSITGLVGLEGSGQEEFVEIIAGLRAPVAGEINVAGSRYDERGLRSQRAAFKAGIAYLPRDRKTEGILPQRSVLENFGIATLPRYTRAGLLSRRRLTARYEQFASDLGIRAASPSAPIRSLSGGNQQKVLLARWLAADPQLLVLNDPSRGVDHATKQAMYRIFRSVVDAGATIVLLSTELEEAMAVSDRVFVFRDGSAVGPFDGPDLERENLMASMFGVSHE